MIVAKESWEPTIMKSVKSVRKWSLLVAGGMLAATFAVADAKEVSTFKIGNWNGGVYTNDNTGVFSHCAASVGYKSGITLIFAVTRDLTWSMGLVNDKWNLQPDAKHPVTYWVDNGEVRNGTAEVLRSNHVRVRLPGDDNLFDRFRRGRTLEIRTSQQVFKFNLTSTSRMLQSLLQCARRERDRSPLPPTTQPRSDPSNPFGSNNAPAPSADPFSSNNNPAPKPVTDKPVNVARADPPPVVAPKYSGGPTGLPTSADRAEATTAVNDIMAGANLGTHRILFGDQAPAALRSHDLVWQFENGIYGSLRIISPNEGIAIGDVNGAIMASDSRGCRGRFASGVLSAGTASDLFTACDGAGGWTAYYTSASRLKGGFDLLALLGGPSDGDAVKVAGTALSNAAARVLVSN